MIKVTALVSLFSAATVLGQVQPSGVTRPIVEDCGFNGTVVCVNRYVSGLQCLSGNPDSL
jgi:hypothetical protein